MKARINMLDPTPFVEWYDRQSRVFGQAYVCRQLGWDADAAARKVYRWRVEGNECEDPLSLYDACFMADVDFFDLYDSHFRAQNLYDVATRRPIACGWDERYERFRAKLLDVGDDFVEPPPPPPPPPPPAPPPPRPMIVHPARRPIVKAPDSSPRAERSIEVPAKPKARPRAKRSSNAGRPPVFKPDELGPFLAGIVREFDDEIARLKEARANLIKAGRRAA